MANLPVIAFNKGKLTKLIDARSDVEAYSSGCRILQNTIPLIYGPVTRRPGTKFITNVEDHDVKSRAVSFIFSATIAYELEFSDQILNVYFEGTLIEGDIVTPYLEADLFALQFKQSADVMWIVHPNYAPRKLSRLTVTDFSLDVITFDKGPFIERNDIAEEDGVTIGVTGLTVATATAGAVGVGKFTFTNATDISSLFPANKRFYIADSTANDGAYTISADDATTYVGTTVTIFANETIPNGADDGQIMVSGAEVTLAASSSTFVTGDDGHTGALFKLTHKRLKTVAKGSVSVTGVVGDAIDVKGNFTYVLNGNWGMTVEIQRLADGTNWETFRTHVSSITNGQGSQTVQKSEVELDDNIQFRINVISADATAGTLEASLTVNESTQDSIFRITATASMTSATAIAVVSAPDNTAITRWAEGAWSAVRGYPSAITFFGERAVYGFTDSDGQGVWLSQAGKFEDFEAGLNDADSFGLRLPTANKGRWLGSLETLAAGTSGDEWRIRATTLDQALTPKNFDIKKQTQHGSANIQSLEVNEAILFIDSVARKVREYTFSDPKQKYVSPDLTALAEDITSGGITSAAVQKNPDSIIWFTIANSPYLISMTYEREQNVVAFAEHPLGGDGIAESVTVSPSTSEDRITLTGQWTISGLTRRFIVEMQPRDFGSTTDATNSFFVDAGIVDTSGELVIENLGHLEGKEVAVLVDGAVQASKTVSSGQITIDESGDRAVVGLPIVWQVSPMRPDVTTQGGTTHGSIMFVPEIVLSFFATGVSGVKFGDGTNQKSIPARTVEPYGSPPDLFTGDTDALGFDGGFNKDMDIVISGSLPLPCTLRAIILRAQKTGR